MKFNGLNIVLLQGPGGMIPDIFRKMWPGEKIPACGVTIMIPGRGIVTLELTGEATLENYSAPVCDHLLRLIPDAPFLLLLTGLIHPYVITGFARNGGIPVRLAAPVNIFL